MNKHKTESGTAMNFWGERKMVLIANSTIGIIFQVMALVILIQQASSRRTGHVERCVYKDGEVTCQKHLHNEEDRLLPHDSCTAKDCGDCVIAWKSGILKGKSIAKIDTFIAVPNFTIPGKAKVFECESQGFPCDCTAEKPCKGSKAICSTLPCEKDASCTCRAREVSDTLWHEDESGSDPNPVIISYEYCAAEIHKGRHRRAARHHKRRLLEEENAAFDVDNVHVSFADPVFTVSTPGMLIIRTQGLERIYHLKATNLQAVTPEEFLRDAGQLRFIFVTTDGKTARGDIQISGRSECRRVPCLICTELFYHMRCLPPALNYAIYAGCIILCAVTVLYVKTAISAIVTVAVGIWRVGSQIYRAMKGTARISMIGGAALGRGIRRRAEITRQYLERAGAPMEANLPLVLLAMFFVLTIAAGSCNNHIIISSQAQNCEHGLEDETCETSTQIQISLENLHYEQCLWITDENKNNLFSLSVKLNKVVCQWDTRREYFTFPTKLEVLKFVACPQNEFCAYGLHCVDGKSFPTETPESKDFPGVNRCMALDSGSSQCVIIDSQACLFLRAYLIPDYLRTYEVRTVNGYHCTYQLEVKEGNGTSDVSVLRNSAASPSGIRMKVLGAYDQPNQYSSFHLITRVGNPKEAYLDEAAPVGRPSAAHIGDVQANQSLTKSFIFSENMITCSTYEEDLRCSKPRSYLETIAETKRSAIPRAIGYHYFTIDAHETLKSELLFTSPVTVHLEFEKYRFHIERRTVCPKFGKEQVKAQGCYACEPLAKITFTAHTTCAEGFISVTFERIGIATRSIRLSKNMKHHVIEFRAQTRCVEDKLCLQGRTVQACIPLSFCLEPAHIELTHPNLSYVQVYSGPSGGIQWSKWSNILPWSGLSSLWRTMGVTIGGVLIIIFGLSAIITCLKN